MGNIPRANSPGQSLTRSLVVRAVKCYSRYEAKDAGNVRFQEQRTLRPSVADTEGGR
jgi:hypothetical protein